MSRENRPTTDTHAAVRGQFARQRGNGEARPNSGANRNLSPSNNGRQATERTAGPEVKHLRGRQNPLRPASRPHTPWSGVPYPENILHSELLTPKMHDTKPSTDGPYLWHMGGCTVRQRQPSLMRDSASDLHFHKITRRYRTVTS